MALSLPLESWDDMEKLPKTVAGVLSLFWAEKGHFGHPRPKESWEMVLVSWSSLFNDNPRFGIEI